MNFVRIVHTDPDIAPAVVSERAAAAYAQRGWQLDALVSDPTPVDEGQRELHRPQKNDTTAAWRTYAVALGAENGGLSVTEAFDKSRDELVAQFGEPAKTPSSAPAKTETKEN